MNVKKAVEQVMPLGGPYERVNKFWGNQCVGQTAFN
jgi:hypothetical protein